MTKNGDFYETSPIYNGWRRNSNVSIKVIVKVRHCFFDVCINNTVMDSSTYTFLTENDPSVGTKGSPKAAVKLPQGKSISYIPGFEFLLLAAAIVIAIMIKRHDRN